MKKTWLVAGAAVVLVTMLGIVLSSGCEEAKGTRSLTVDPSYVDLTGAYSTSSNGASQTFTVTQDSLQDLSLPLKWSVSDPSLGSIATSGGRSASYRRTNKHGDNGILVEDQYSAQGTASIHQ